MGEVQVPAAEPSEFGCVTSLRVDILEPASTTGDVNAEAISHHYPPVRRCAPADAETGMRQDGARRWRWLSDRRATPERGRGRRSASTVPRARRRYQYD